MVFFVPILYALGGIAIRAAAPAAARALLSLGAKKITTEAAKKLPGAIITATPKVLKQLKKVGPKGGPKAKPKGKVTTKQPSQFGPGGVTVKPTTAKPKPQPNAVKPKPKKPTKVKPGSSTSGGKAKKGGLKTKKRKSPFAKETKAQTAARIKKEKIAAQRMKDNNKTNPSRDPKGKYNQRPIGGSNVPKSGGAKKGGLKSRIDAKAKRAAMGLGVAAVKADNLSQGEIEIGPRTPLPNKAKNPSAARKKPMQNPRSLKRKAPVKKPPVKKPEVKKDESFGAAFKRNRAADKPTFPWRDPKTGKTGKYTTRLKEESIKDHKKKFGVTGKY